MVGPRAPLPYCYNAVSSVHVKHGLLLRLLWFTPGKIVYLAGSLKMIVYLVQIIVSISRN